MTLDFSALTPLPAPTAISRTALVVGEQIQQSPAQLLAGFESVLKKPGAAESEEIALVVTTSGSTGMPKQTALSARALHASARATEAFVGAANAQWLLSLPTHYVAGAQVLARSVIAGTNPVLAGNISQNLPFSPQVFLDAARQLTANQIMMSLVPAQLHKLFESEDSEVLDALRSFTAILLGGAPASQALIDRAQAEGVQVIRTYGSAETAGGCVYEGQPLEGVQLAIEGDQAEGRVWLGGRTLASGYLKDPERTAQHFFADSQGNTWYKTDDVGAFASRLCISGRIDDVLISGGIKLSPKAIAEVIETDPAVREALVFGLEDARWGQAVCAAISTKDTSHTHLLKERICAVVREKLGKAAVPKQIEVLADFPTLSTGKPDRQALKKLLAASYQASSYQG